MIKQIGKRFTIPLMGCLVVLLLSSLIIGACTPTPAAEEEQEINLYASVDLTGFMGHMLAPMMEGYWDYTDYVNETEGGVGGYKVNWIWADDGNSSARQVSNYKRWQSEGDGMQFLVAGVTATNEMLKDWYVENEIFAWAQSTSTTLSWPPTWNFVSTLPDHKEEFGAMVKLVREIWDKEGRSGMPRLAVVGPDEVWIRENASPAILGLACMEKVDLSSGIAYAPIITADLTPQISRLVGDVKDPQIDFLYNGALIQTGTAAAKGLAALGLSGKVRLLGPPHCDTDIMLDRLGPTLTEGYISSAITPTPRAKDYNDNPGIKLARDLAQQKHGREPDVQYCRGMSDGQRIIEVIRRAIAATGGIPDARDYYDALQTLQNWQGSLELCPPVTVIPDDIRIQKHLIFHQVQNGEIVKYRDWMEVPFTFPKEYADRFPGYPSLEEQCK